MILKNFFTENKSLWCILLLAAALRFIGIWPGFPPYHPDEGMSYAQGIAILKDGLDAHGYSLPYAYPSLIPLINAFFFQYFFLPLSWAHFYISHLSNLIDGLIQVPLTKDEYNLIYHTQIIGERELNVLSWGRCIAALFGVGVVFLTYIVGKKIFDKRVGLFSAALVAVNFRQVLNSHIDLPDIYNAFSLLLAFWGTLNLLQKPSRTNYLFAGILAGLSFSTKFQIFSFIPLFIVHIFLFFDRKVGKRRINFLFSREVLISAGAALLTFLLLNPSHIIHFEETKDALDYVSLKYAAGRMEFNFYSFWYLFNIGIGRLTSALAIVGILWGLVRNFKKTLLLLSIIIPFFFVMVYYSNGGFYTRNFVTITPFILIFTGLLINSLHRRGLGIVLAILVLGVLLFENLQNSIVIPIEYSKKWNFEVLSSWLQKNLSSGSKIAAHSSVPLPIESVKRYPYEFDIAFSLDEFTEEGADYAIANFDWVTNDSYWWMSRSYVSFWEKWIKPDNTLRETYPALTLDELSYFSLNWVFNPWQAPDSDFLVAKLPQYRVVSKKKALSYNFLEDKAGWEPKGKLQNCSGGELDRKERMLVILPTSLCSPIYRWESPPFLIEGWSGFDIKAIAKSLGSLPNKKVAFIYIKFYSSEEDARASKNRLSVRLSSRNGANDDFTLKLIGEVPPESHYAVVGFQAYNLTNVDALYLKSVEIDKAKVESTIKEGETGAVAIDSNIMFPNSHGGL